MTRLGFLFSDRGSRREMLRRLLVLIALMFWQGGFTFYAAVVVPVGQSVLGSHRKQGFITREVTVYLNLAGAIALVPLGWDVAAGCQAHGFAWAWDSLTRWRGVAWLFMAAAQGILFWLHTQLNQLMDPDKSVLLDLGAFRTGHRWYLWVSTAQWAAAVVFAILTLFDWSSADRARGGLSVPE